LAKQMSEAGSATGGRPDKMKRERRIGYLAKRKIRQYTARAIRREVTRIRAEFNNNPLRNSGGL